MFYTVNELKDLLKLSTSQVYALIETGRLKCHRFTTRTSGAIRVSQGQLDEYLNATEEEKGASVPPSEGQSRPSARTSDFKELDGERLHEAWEGRR
jgi:excisionase family DNA binding protein